jgi:hypothetical protein
MHDAIRAAAEYWFADTELKLAEIVQQTAERLWLHLYEKRLTAYFFGDGVLLKGRQNVDHDFWATEAALRVLGEGRYFPFGRGQFSYEAKPSFALFVLETELRALLEKQQKQAPLPAAKKPELANAMRRFDELPREAQRKTVSELPEFQKYHLTDADYREAAKSAPRKPGRKPKRK